ncbi:MAG: LysM peptidoglycan-binding domain-containing protein [Dehalococcoidia bacterium]|nr:LysM peptidoglycan-binding domain-containing protein [Dehalococcoidia bacterium]
MVNSRVAERQRTKELLPFLLRLLGPVGVVVAVAAGFIAYSTVSATQTHVVQPGETLSHIAASYGVSVQEIASMNNISNVDLIIAGSALTIGAPSTPAPSGTYTVQPGDTLERIAREHGVLVRDLVEVNSIRDANLILIGQILTVPGSPTTVTGYRVSYDTAEAALRSAEREYGLPSGLVLALSWQESGWQQHVVSEAGAVGLMQIMPDTATWALEWLAPGSTDWYGDPVHNAHMGAAILRHWLHLADGDVAYALGAYYQGWHSMETDGPYLETDRYVANVLALLPQFA